MASNKVAELYNRLFLFEHDKKDSKQYPIHKKLSHSFGYQDIYEYITAKEKIENKTILDAGCGVGFGSTLLVEKGAKKVHGVSISKFEIDQAIQFQKHQKLSFEVASFAHTKKAYYDLIICVESLKHSLDFRKDYFKLLEGLKPNGKLIIVDDFYEGKENKKLTALMRKWELNYILTEKNIKQIAKNEKITVDDLTEFVQKKMLLKLKIIRFFSQWFMSKKTNEIFEGGWILDELYTKGLMTYKLISIQKI